MSYFDDASLVMIPSGYKDQKVYSVKPIDGSGDLTFSRASNATRVNSSGLVEKVRTSEFTYNTDFTNVAWTKQSTTAVADQIANPVNGAVDADLFYPNSTGTYRAIRRNIGASLVEVGISIYAKAGGKNILFFNDSAGTRQVAFDLSAGTYANTSATAISMESLGGGWYRCAFSAVTEMLYMCVTDGTGNSSVTANGTDGIYIWGQQTEYGVPTEFIGVTTSTAVSVGPVSGLPRLDYSGGASCPSLLLEPQRSNLLTFSEQFDNAAWTKSNLTVTPNAAISPDGYQNADKIVGSVAIPDLRTASSVSITSGASYTWSAYVKNAGYKYVRLTAWTADDPVTIYDLDAISVVSETGPAHTSTIEDAGNGWRRITITRTSSNSIAWFRCIPLSDSTATSPQNGVDGIYLWGAQLEAGAYATSYIPTLSSAVTRVADSASKTGISSLIGQTEGTFFIEFSSLSNSVVNEQISLSDGTDSNTIKFVMGSVISGIQAESRLGGVTQFSIKKTTSDYSSVKKMAVSYKQNDIVFYINGVQIGTDSAATIPALSVFNFASGSGAFNATGNTKQVLLFTQRLSNADLATLTTL